MIKGSTIIRINLKKMTSIIINRNNSSDISRKPENKSELSFENKILEKKVVVPEKIVVTPKKVTVVPEKIVVTPKKVAVSPKKVAVSPKKAAVKKGSLEKILNRRYSPNSGINKRYKMVTTFVR